MSFIADIWTKAKRAQKILVLPESDDSRVLKAAELIVKSKLADIILVGDPQKIEKLSLKASADLSKIQIVDSSTSPRFEEYAHKYKLKREHKGMTLEKAREVLSTEPLMYAGMMVDSGEADGLVAGAAHFTADTIRAAVHCVGLAKGISVISSFFVMLTHKPQFGEGGLLFYADCGVVPNPSAEELSEIALTTAESFTKLTGLQPRVAMLSFSTKTSAVHPDVEKVIKATQLAKEKKPDLLIDGELQVDAALLPNVSRRKAPGSVISGHANILIFPDLDAGNIGYKLTQRLGGATALGPILQGCLKPVNDLSRGCSVDDIVNVAAITSVQCH